MDGGPSLAFSFARAHDVAMSISLGGSLSWLIWLVLIGIGALCLAVTLLVKRHAAQQAARMNLVEAMWVDKKPAAAPAQPKREAPYRSAPAGAVAPAPVAVQTDPDAELAQLAAEGQRREREANAARDNQIECVRLERLCDAMQLLPEAYGAATVPSTAEFPAPGELVYGQEDSTSAPPEAQLVASAARKALAERAWLASLPFPVERYFAVLAEPPKAIFALEVTVELCDPSRMPSLGILRGIVHVHDVGAEVVIGSSGGAITILVGDDAVSLAGYFPYTVQKIAPYVHGLVDQALLPLHRSHSIARVSLART